MVDEAGFRRRALVRIAAEQGVSVWYTAPTAIRMLMKAGAELAAQYAFPGPALHRQRRRAAQSGGRVVGQRRARPADPRQLVADRNRRHHDRQHLPPFDIKPGSMGRPLPGIDAAIVRAPRAGVSGVCEEMIAGPDRGRTGAARGWPSMFRGYLGQRGALPQVLCRRVVPDRRPGRRDADGYYWFVGRATT
jgi:acetyl-CoA synthetase